MNDVGVSSSPALQASAKGDLSSNVPQSSHQTAFWGLVVGSLGVVYGDIGTSPLYVFRTAIASARGGDIGFEENVIGILSLILWTLTISVTIKYVCLILRADNNGEGGTLSLMALAQRAIGRQTFMVFVLGVLGAALFAGDAVITPAISVLSAVEGLKFVSPQFTNFVLPLTVIILIALFVFQSKGTDAVGKLFGPIMIVWFLTLAIGGVSHIADSPKILLALNPGYAATFLWHKGALGVLVLGSVFLAVTGGEALYADLGHFRRGPIQTAWLGLVFPCLGINYVGQGAMLLSHPDTATDPFFLLFPKWATLPIVILATLATIIASQATITGAFSLFRQAIQLRLLPRLIVKQTSASNRGQIYLPQINFILLAGVLFLVLAFRSSDNLAAAYGVAVTGTELVTTSLMFIVITKYWKFSTLTTILMLVPFFLLEVVFLSANLTKILEGGYLPLTFAAVLCFTMWTWMRGTKLLGEKIRAEDMPLDLFMTSAMKSEMKMAKGTAVYLTSNPGLAPTAMLHVVKHFNALHQQNVFLTVLTAEIPQVADADRVQLTRINEHFSHAVVNFGFMEDPNVPLALSKLKGGDIDFTAMKISYVLSRRRIKPAAGSELPPWQDNFFVNLTRVSANAADYFHIPIDQSVEIGHQYLV
jgi:KUP system potassium uptake protein